jgi:serine phosphatase RsbU (regulator of sigma subunit)
MIKIKIIEWNKSSTKIVIVVFLALLILSSYFIVSSYRNYLKEAQSSVLKNLEAISNTLSLQMDASDQEYLNTLFLDGKKKSDLIKDSIFIRSESKLKKADQINNVEEPISIIFFNHQNNKYYFISNSSDTSYFGDPFLNTPNEFKEMYENGGTLGPYIDEFGTWLSALTPIKNRENKTVGALEVDMKFDSFIGEANKILFFNLAASILIFVITTFILLRYVRVVLVGEEIIKSKLEISNKIIEEKNNDIIQSINYAKKIQTAILPPLDLINEYLPNSFVLYMPKDIVSGDFYYFHPTDDPNVFLIAVVDCTGHGVPGALMSMIGNDILKHIINEKKIIMPDKILGLLNEGIVDVLKQEGKYEESKDGMDIALCLINKHDNKLYFSGANRPLIYFENNVLNIIKPNKMAIGGTGGSMSDEKKIFSLTELPLQNKYFYLFTDGYVDQFGGAANKKLQTKRFQALLSETYQSQWETQKIKLKEYVEDWKGTIEQTDDILVVGFKI